MSKGFQPRSSTGMPKEFRYIFPTLLFLRDAFDSQKKFLQTKLKITQDIKLLNEKEFLDGVQFYKDKKYNEFKTFYNDVYLKNKDHYIFATYTLIFSRLYGFYKFKYSEVEIYYIIYVGLYSQSIFESIEKKNNFKSLEPFYLINNIPKYIPIHKIEIELKNNKKSFEELLIENQDKHNLLFLINRGKLSSMNTKPFAIQDEFKYINKKTKIFKKYIIKSILQKDDGIDKIVHRSKPNTSSNTNAYMIWVNIFLDKDEENKFILEEKLKKNRVEKEKKRKEEQKEKKKKKELEKKKRQELEKEKKKQKKGLKNLDRSILSRRKGKSQRTHLNNFEKSFEQNRSDKKGIDRLHKSDYHKSDYHKNNKRPRSTGSILNYISNNFSSSHRKDKNKEKKREDHKKPNLPKPQPKTQVPKKEDKKVKKNVEKKITNVPSKKKMISSFDKELYFVGLIEFLVRNHLPDLHYFIVKGYDKHQKQIDDYIVDISYSLRSKIHFTKMSKLLYHIFYQIYHSKVHAYLTLELFTAKKFKFSSDMTKNEETLFKEKFIENMKNNELSQVFVREMIQKFKDLTH